MSASAVIWCTITSGAAARTAASHRRAIEPVEDHRRRARRTQLRGLAWCPGGGGDLMTRRDQAGHEVLPECPGRSRDEDSHGLSSCVVPFPPRQGTTRSCDTRETCPSARQRVRAL